MLGDDRLRAALALERRQLLARLCGAVQMPRAPLCGYGDRGGRDDEHRQPDELAHLRPLSPRGPWRGTPIVDPLDQRRALPRSYASVAAVASRQPPNAGS